MRGLKPPPPSGLSFSAACERESCSLRLPSIMGFPQPVNPPAQSAGFQRISAEAGALYSGLGEVFAGIFSLVDIFGDAGEHSVADAVAERGLAGGALGIGFGAVAGWKVLIIGGNDGGLLVVVAGVQDEGDRVPDPLVGFLGAEVVKHQHFGGEDGLEQIEFGG